MGAYTERVRGLYASAGYSVEHPPGPGAIARRLLGPRAIQSRSDVVGVRSVVCDSSGRWVLLVSRRAPPPTVCFGIARELARWALYRDGHYSFARADLDDFGAQIVLPTAAVVAAVFRDRMTVADVAQQYVCTEELVRRRLNQLRPQSGAYERPAPSSRRIGAT